MERILLTMRGFFRKERLEALPTDSGVAIVFRGYRKDDGYCVITKFIKAFRCANIRGDILSYSSRGEGIVEDGAIDYYAYAILDEQSAGIAANVLNAKINSAIEEDQIVENDECDMELVFDGAVPLMWSDRCEIKFKKSDFGGGTR